jgi:hypothetical protein
MTGALLNWPPIAAHKKRAAFWQPFFLNLKAD